MKNELTPLQAWEEVKDEMLEWTEGYDENFGIIETSLKALEIIKERKVNISLLESSTVIEYNEKYNCLISGSIKYLLNQQEYNLLKEILL